MNDNYIRNREGRIIARRDGAWLRDGTGTVVSRYDAWDGRTRDGRGRIVDDGDLRLNTLRDAESPDSD